MNNGILTPYFSAGHYFNPQKWGGKDLNGQSNLTYSSNYKEIGGIKGYPYIDDRLFFGSPKPMGLPRVNSDYENTKTSDNKNGIGDLISGDGEIKSANNLTYDQLTSAQELRSHVISFKQSETSTANSSTEFIESFKYEGNLGNKKSFSNDENVVVLEPLYYTTKMIIIFVDKDTTKKVTMLKTIYHKYHKMLEINHGLYCVLIMLVMIILVKIKMLEQYF